MKNIMLTFIASSVAILFVLTVFSCCATEERDNAKCDISFLQEMRPDLIIKGPITFSEMQNEYSNQIRNATVGNEYKSKWERFVLLARNRDTCIFGFSSNQEAWNSLSGIKGFSLTKDNKLIEIFIVTMS